MFSDAEARAVCPTSCIWGRKVLLMCSWRLLRRFSQVSFRTDGGHNFDGCAPGTLMARASIKEGEIVFPNSVRYRLLALPQIETMTPELSKKIAELVEAGATVVGIPQSAADPGGTAPWSPDPLPRIPQTPGETPPMHIRAAA